MGGRLKLPSKQDTPPEVTSRRLALLEGDLDSVTKPRDRAPWTTKPPLPTSQDHPKSHRYHHHPLPRRRRPHFLFRVVVSVHIANPSRPSLGHACLGHALGASRAERAQRLVAKSRGRFSRLQPPAFLSPAPTLEPALAFVCPLQAQLVFGNVDRSGSTGLRGRRDHETTHEMWPTRRA